MATASALIRPNRAALGAGSVASGAEEAEMRWRDMARLDRVPDGELFRNLLQLLVVNCGQAAQLSTS